MDLARTSSSGQRGRLAHPRRRRPPGPARGRRRRPRRWTYAEFNAWVNRSPTGWPPRSTSGATRSAWPRATAPSSSPSTTPARSSASSACRSTWAGGRRGGLRARPLAGQAASWSRPSSSTRWSRRLREGRRRHRGDRGPRHRRRVRRRARRPALGHAGRRGPRHATRPSRTRRRRPRPAQLPLHLGHHVVPEGRGRQPPGDLPGVDVQRAGFRLDGRRPVRGHDADVPHRPAQRVLHARGAWSAPPSTCCAASTRERCSTSIERERITQVFGLPMMYRAMLEHPSFARARPLRRCSAPSTRWRPCPTR